MSCQAADETPLLECEEIANHKTFQEPGLNGLESAVKEAVHLIREGEANDKPRKQVKRVMTAYAIVRHPFYYWIHFLSTLALMTLAFWEQETVSQEEDPLEEKAVYLTIEMLLLLLIGFNFVLHVIWRGPTAFINSRSIFLILVLGVMFAEALAILSRNQRHFRVTRALRPLLLLDTHFMMGARRIIRQIIRCAKYIIDVLLILFFLIALAALISYYLFADTDPTYFPDLGLSFVSTFIAMTTANNPDVFMEAYVRHKATPIFFAVFFIVTSYCFINLLAVVIVKFKDEAELKYKSLCKHRWEALRSAYCRLVEKQDGGGVLKFNRFLQLMSSYQPQLAEHEVMCVYMSLQVNPDIKKGLSEEEFLNLYQCLGLSWEFVDTKSDLKKTGKSTKVVPWYEYKYINLPQKLKSFMSGIHIIMNHRLFNYFMMLCVLGNLILLIAPTAIYTSTCPAEDKQFCIMQSPGGLTGSFLFTILYAFEVTTRLVLVGARRYFGKWWNWLDLAVVYGAFICLCVESAFNQGDLEKNPFWLRYLVIVRPLILIRLLRLQPSYFYLVKIMSALFFRLYSIFFLMMCVFYSYAIVGMEVFGSKNNTVYPGCCGNASYNVGEYFSANRTSLVSPNVYWLNNFESLYAAFVTLYELMVVNNWFIIMEGFVSTTNWAARIYFMFFWVVNIIVINVSTAYILDGFELFYFDLAEKEHLVENHTFIGLKKHAWVKITGPDKSELNQAVASFKDKREYSWRRYSPVGFILWWKRRTFNKLLKDLDLHDSQSAVMLHGAKPLSDYDIKDFKYMSKIPQWKNEKPELERTKITKQCCINYINYITFILGVKRVPSTYRYC